jgi:hypothetical protein
MQTILFFNLYFPISSSSSIMLKELESSLMERRPELILVLSFGTFTKLVLSQIGSIYFSQHSWVFNYKSQGHKVVDDLNHEFKEFIQIDLSSRLFVLVTDENNQSIEFYELYRKSTRNNLTISQLCSSKLKLCSKPDLIWNRRKDLSGVHFQVAVRPDTLLQNSNGVSPV